MSAPAIAAATVKADAYGFGILRAAPTLSRVGCRRVYTFSLEEALLLRRKAGLSADHRICFFSAPSSPEECEEAARNALIPAIHSAESLALWQQYCAKHGALFPFILHFDTGMTRYGFCDHSAPIVAKQTDKMRDGLLGVMSHLASADIPDHPQNQEQLTRFRKALRYFPGTPGSLANSSGLTLGADFHFSETRPGAALFGINPLYISGAPSPMNTVLTLTATVLEIYKLDIAATVGYYGRGRAAKGMTVATLSGGYADGIPSSAGEGAAGCYAPNGAYCPTIGRVSMDVTSINATAAANILVPGKTVEWCGEKQSLDILAKNCKSNGYEMLTGIRNRAKKRYI